MAVPCVGDTTSLSSQARLKACRVFAATEQASKLQESRAFPKEPATFRHEIWPSEHTCSGPSLEGSLSFSDPPPPLRPPSDGRFPAKAPCAVLAAGAFRTALLRGHGARRRRNGAMGGKGIGSVRQQSTVLGIETGLFFVGTPSKPLVS